MSTMTKAPALVVRREIEASAEELFDAWLDPESLSRWMLCCPAATSARDSSVKVDARVGGAFEIVMHEGRADHPHRGTYQEIDRPRRLSFTWISEATGQRETLVTVEFRAGSRARHTEIVLTHEGLQDAAARANHDQGWTVIFDNLAARRG